MSKLYFSIFQLVIPHSVIKTYSCLSIILFDKYFAKYLKMKTNLDQHILTLVRNIISPKQVKQKMTNGMHLCLPKSSFRLFLCKIISYLMESTYI